MTLQQRIGLGIQLGYVQSSSSTPLAGIIDGLSGPDASADTVDITLLGDTFKSFAKGQVDPGEVTLDVAYDPLESTGSTLSAMLAAVNQPAYSFYIYYPPAGSESSAVVPFSAHVTGLGQEIAKDKTTLRKVTLKLTGDPGFPGG